MRVKKMLVPLVLGMFVCFVGAFLIAVVGYVEGYDAGETYAKKKSTLIVDAPISGPTQPTDPDADSFDRGFNLCLDSHALLDLELSISGDRKTWGERADILRSRHKISNAGPIGVNK
jgi:hypothetical protein